MSSFRKDYDVEHYRDKVKEEEQRARAFAKENEQRISNGQKPLSRTAFEQRKGPKPTHKLQQRDKDLALDKNTNRTVVVAQGTRQNQPGFFCEVCSRTYKDSASYLDHINSRAHLRKLGQTVDTERSTIHHVRARIALLKEQTKEASQKKDYDFRKRVGEIRQGEIDSKMEKRASRKAKKSKNQNTIDNDQQDDQGNDEMARIMGFTGFGG
ncbi:hypothetical protein E3P92_01654 [Wallemia ichthyophaga]|uniref:C2H2-type domain-containing protein n=2 Tax=Wallemia ichthyophaga TaxID=245174 RepID=A0A4T0IL22_WALIC|nr:Zinc finger matrin-type protein 2 [Wallemia ichthyophaga EXF-994]TIA91713.1 hypothetical protein E3P97_01854 [Wallemia ichthyophaga]EOR00182.1 Zinc finger matrin-type protein 2 [Wallemia ichthyophaga EXF-994]TIA96388.1 hypothetical protein E3P95_03303 [Wallemia ichthyophaga]TIA99251.1 hypothetical protein E3P94_02647 [Wallemia ichthyophaga]TIB04468.1 hypothetical protein E3P96_01616 [Wallemia ichthyophaga]